MEIANLAGPPIAGVAIDTADGQGLIGFFVLFSGCFSPLSRYADCGAVIWFLRPRARRRAELPLDLHAVAKGLGGGPAEEIAGDQHIAATFAAIESPHDLFLASEIAFEFPGQQAPAPVGAAAAPLGIEMDTIFAGGRHRRALRLVQARRQARHLLFQTVKFFDRLGKLPRLVGGRDRFSGDGGRRWRRVVRLGRRFRLGGGCCTGTGFHRRLFGRQRGRRRRQVGRAETNSLRIGLPSKIRSRKT